MCRLVAALVAAAACVAPAPSATAARDRPTIRLVTFNIYKDLDRAEWQADWNRLKTSADIVFLQETPNVRVRSLADRRTWKVFQARAQYPGEVALAVRGSAVRTVARFHVVRMLTHRSCRPGLVVGSRYLATARVVLRDGRALTIAATHLPPGNCSGPYRTMIAHVRSWAKAHQSHLVLGADWNRAITRDPGDIAGSTNLRPHGVGIDGFQINRRIPVTRTRILGSDAEYHSDHVPVQVTIRR
jgi:endonuclease/exonuclease/phosphatase family metal-dependent hydrolase